MARGNATHVQVFYKGSSGDVFTVFVESEEAIKQWKNDSSIPLAQVVAGYKIMMPEHGKQGVLNTASNSQLENEFGTKNEDEIIKKILQQGEVQSSENPERQGSTNDSMGAMAAH
ncbi:Nn.00g070950.m01.CDS01 [Neocucurbitaria sp. VM-36]